MEKIAIIDYGSGNLRSAAKAFETVAENATITVSADAADIAAADRIVLPGQGAFGDCMAGLSALPGMMDALNETVIEKQRPFLGICVGMQLMLERGLEHGEHEGLSWIGGDVVPMAPSRLGLKIPHMGWNNLLVHDTAHPVLKGIGETDDVYFVHSYEVKCTDPAALLASADYGGDVAATIGRDNMVGTQFHPEKSQRAGLRLIKNFMNWRP